jgi:hypothetical protein
VKKIIPNIIFLIITFMTISLAVNAADALTDYWSVDYQGNIASVRLVANSPDADVDSIELLISKNNYRPVAMTLFMSGMGRVEVRMTNYSAKCESSASLYECPVADFPSAEVVDMR